MKKQSFEQRPALETSVLWKAMAGMGILVFLMFVDMLLAPGTFVLGNRGTDMYMQFFSWWQFGFGEMAKGNLPLWNPHVYGGAPYFGGMQGALLYPVNLLLMFLPASLELKINWSIAVNVWLMGVFMYTWAGYRGLRPLACFAAGVIMMFCGPHFMHVYSGHPVHMAVMTWAPVVFLSLDGILENLRLRRMRGVLFWIWIGMFAVTMQVLAGHPQYVFYTGVTAGLYMLWGMVRLARETGFLRGFLAPGAAMAAMYAGGCAISAVQLLSALQSNAETIRGIPVPIEFVSMFGFPPENLLTLLNPYFFGDMSAQPYWGRCYLWEMSLFMGVSGLALAIYGAVKTRSWKLVTLAGVTFILALGIHTPLFHLLYHHAPMFGKFRGWSKFTFQTVLMMGMLAALGLDVLLRKGAPSRKWVIGFGSAAGVVLLASLVIAVMSAVEWRGVMQSVLATRESYLHPAAYANLPFVDQARGFSAGALALGGLLLGVTAALFYFWQRSRWVSVGLVAVLTAEVFFFALHTRDSFDTRTIAPAAIADFLKKYPAQERSLNLLNSNSAMSMNAFDLWGHDPGVLLRYAEFMAWSQGGDPDQATQYVQFRELDSLYAMLRLHWAFIPAQNGVQMAQAKTPPMEQVQLVPAWKVIPKRDDIFKAMREPDFDPRKVVILEQEPEFSLGLSRPASGDVRITRQSTDWLEIEANITGYPRILLITDAWSPAWRAVALPGSSQKEYQLLPANYTLRAVPLPVGQHKLRVEYAPREYTLGKWISILSLLGFFAAAVWWRLTSREKRA